ncbi:uncharacterized protein ppp1r3aa [Syngnathus acus]|uniref:uncharacterized protein ppp1r3aa n=1 Tax=Syngnathus acus TaxID=161584 RepID=UPI001885EC07|nr:uncharacterized protein ppp1r3aa [Syngnathus acus]
MEALSIQPLEEDRLSLGRQEEEVRMEAFPPWGSTADEEEPEWEATSTVRRKVSFADAFGLNLVSVKEYDDVHAGEDTEGKSPPQEEFYLSCLFTAPSSEEELVRRLEEQMVELERVELLPGTTNLRGYVRVLNLCFSKSVYARITLDGWKSHFDLPADYVPGSSDRKTDRFTFQYTVALPLEKEGTRVEFCLCYETSAGTFWANNQEMNYVMFCHLKSPAKQQVQEELKMKRSCLRTNRRASTQEKEFTDMLTLAAEAEDPRDAVEMRAEGPSLFLPAERKPLVASLKSRQRAGRLAHVKDILSQRWRDPANTLQPSGEYLLERRRKQVLTYHQIPLITLDWDNEKQKQWVSSNMDRNIWTGRAKVETAKAALSVNDIWGTFLNGKSPSPDHESPVCDVWQAFIHGPRNCGVSESEWLQTAALVPPASENQNVPRNAEPATSSHALPDHVSLNSEDRQTPGAVGGAENITALGSPVLVSCDSVDILSKCHKHEEAWIKGGLHETEQLAAAVETSQRELTTTDTTAKTRDGHEISRRGSQEWEEPHNAIDDKVASWDASDGLAKNCDRAVTFTEEPQKNQSAESYGIQPANANQIGDAQPKTEGATSCKNLENIHREKNVFRALEVKNEESDTSGDRVGISKNGATSVIEPTTTNVHDDVLDPDESHATKRGTERVQTKQSHVDTRESEPECRQIGDDSVKRVHGPSRRNTKVDQDPAGSNPTEESQSPSRGSGGFMWWSVLYILSHISRMLTCSLLVGGFFVVVVLYEFPAFFVLYMFSMAWWFYKWRGPQGATNKVS